MSRVFVCGGRHFGRVPRSSGMVPFAEANSRINKATRELEQIKALLNSIHAKLAAHWGNIAGVEVKILDQPGKKPPPGVEACLALLKAERVDVFLRFPDPDEAAYLEIDAVAQAINLDVRKVG
jgi:hypothetical protein